MYPFLALHWAWYCVEQRQREYRPSPKPLPPHCSAIIASERRPCKNNARGHCQAAQGTGPSDKHLCYLNILGRFLRKRFHLVVRATKYHRWSSDVEWRLCAILLASRIFILVSQHQIGISPRNFLGFLFNASHSRCSWVQDRVMNCTHIWALRQET